MRFDSPPPQAEQTCDFEGVRIHFDDRVLEPRPWTAAQSHWAAEVAATAPDGPILELCAGVGHIGLLAASLAGRALVAVDIDPVAADFLGRNAEACGVQAQVRVGPLQECLSGNERFPVVVADPPWVPTDEVGRYPEDPELAIDGGADGLALVGACLEAITAHLQPGGAAILQVGPGQADRTRVLVEGREGLAVAGVRRFDRGELLRIDRGPDLPA